MTYHADPVRIDENSIGMLDGESAAAAILYNIALLRADANDLESAADFFLGVLEPLSHRRRKTAESDNAATNLEIMALSNAGYCHYLDENYSDAAFCFERSVDLCRNALDAARQRSSPSTPFSFGFGFGRRSRNMMSRLVESMTNLARAYDGRDAVVGSRGGRGHGRRSTAAGNDAAVLIREARALADTLAKIFGGEDSGDEWRFRDDLLHVEAMVLRLIGETKRAIRTYRRHLSQCRKRRHRQNRHCGGSNANTAIRTAAAMDGIASCLLLLHNGGHENNNLDRAYRVARMALTVRLRGTGETNRDVADSYHLLGFILREREDYVDSVEMMERCVRVRTEVLGCQHPETARAECDMAAIHRRRNDTRSSLEICRRVLAKDNRSGLAAARVLPKALKREIILLESKLVREMRVPPFADNQLLREDGNESGRSSSTCAEPSKDDSNNGVESSVETGGSIHLRWSCHNAAASA